jgi:chromate transport protein ChrA
MARIDLFAFGGGFADLPLMFHEVVDVHAWMDSTTFLNGLALGQVTPGPIVVTATFVGLLLSVTLKLALAVPWSWFSTFLATGTIVLLLLGAEIIWVVFGGIGIAVVMYFVVH